MAIIFAVIAVTCAGGWLVYWLATAALILYILEKGYTEPTEEEWKSCLRKVILHFVKD